MKAPIPNTPEVRCRGCNKLLARGAIEAGDIELHCPCCKTHLHLRAMRPSHAPHDGLHGDLHERESSS